MHKLPAARRGPGVHLARIAALSTALTALTALVVADVTAAETDEPTPLALDAPDDDTHADAPALIALAVPDAVKPAPSILDELVPMLAEEKPKKQKKPRRSKLKFGRFEGY